MADVVNNVLENIVENSVVVNQEKTYKTKDYVRRAKLKYELKKYAEDPEYRTKRLESCKKSQQKNPEKYREYSKLYMREYRAKKKLEAAATITAAIPEQQAPITKQTEHCRTETIEATTAALEALALSRE
jgi:hypothetical protein